MAKKPEKHALSCAAGVHDLKIPFLRTEGVCRQCGQQVNLYEVKGFPLRSILLWALMIILGAFIAVALHLWLTFIPPWLLTIIVLVAIFALFWPLYTRFAIARYLRYPPTKPKNEPEHTAATHGVKRKKKKK